jgi:hypothetical protein
MPESGPSLMEMAFSLNETLTDVLKNAVKTNGIIMAPDDIVRKRWELCFSCEHFNNDSVIPSRCMKCGCGMKLKTRLQAAKCPIGKW